MDPIKSEPTLKRKPRGRTDPMVADAPARPRRRGRQPAEVPSVRVSTWLPIPYTDQLIRLAKERDQSISALVRSLLMLRTR
jgi:hypothetical protein